MQPLVVAADHQQRIDPLRHQQRRQCGTEEGAGVLLAQHHLIGQRRHRRAERRQRVARHHVLHHRRFFDPQAAIGKMACMIADVGVDHRNSRAARTGQQLAAFLDRAHHARREQRRVFGGVGLHKVDRQQRRAPAEAEALAPDAAIVVAEGVVHSASSIGAGQQGAGAGDDRFQLQRGQHRVSGGDGGGDHRFAGLGFHRRNGRQRRHLYAGGQHDSIDLA